MSELLKNYQRFAPKSATLTALAGLNSTAGLVEQTGVDAFTKRLIGTTNESDVASYADGMLWARHKIRGHYVAAITLTSGTTYNDFVPTLTDGEWGARTIDDVFVLQCGHSSTTGTTITGIVPPSVSAPHMAAMLIRNTSTAGIRLSHGSASSSANNRMYLPNSGDLILGPGHGAWLLYDTSLPGWRCLGTTGVSSIVNTSIVASTATNDDWSPTGYSDSSEYLAITPTVDITIKGITGGSSGRVLYFHNASSTANRTITLEYETSTTATNRFYIPDHQKLIIPRRATAMAVYSLSRWRVLPGAGCYFAPITVASLPAAAAANSGHRLFVSDATATTFASTVVGGGANVVPVYSNGTNWCIG